MRSAPNFWPALKTSCAGAAQKASGHSNANQMGLFANGGADPAQPDLPQIEEWSDIEKLNKERETLGFFITGHPLDKYVGRLHGVTS